MEKTPRTISLPLVLHLRCTYTRNRVVNYEREKYEEKLKILKRIHKMHTNGGGRTVILTF